MTNFLITEEGVNDLVDMKQRLDALAPFSVSTPGQGDSERPISNIRGYLMQPISRGASGLCALVSRRQDFRSFKIDLAGIIYKDQPSLQALFQLRFTRNDSTWFTTKALSANNLPVVDLLYEIERASTPASGSPAISMEGMNGALGNPVYATALVVNEDLYPAVDANYKYQDLITSQIGSWIFSIHRSYLPDNPADFDVNLLFTLNGDTPVQLNGPAVMTLTEIPDTPTGASVLVTDIMDIARPSPLVGGTLIAAIPFEDVGYGIISANPREYFFEQVAP